MSDDDSSIYFYDPSVVATVLFTGLFSIPAVILFWQTCYRPKAIYLLCLPFGALVEVAGYAARIDSVKNVDDIGPYAASASFIVIAPLFVAAANYILLGRLMLFVLPKGHQKILGVSPRFMTRIFVGCDVLSLLIQCGGSGVAASENWTGSGGIDVLMAGLATQVATNIVFMALLFVFIKRTVMGDEVSRDAPVKWRTVLWAVVLSIILVFIRSVYRLIEFGLGFKGYPFTHEWIFYVLESTPMFIAISVFCFVFPGRYLPSKKQTLSTGGVEAGFQSGAEGGKWQER